METRPGHMAPRRLGDWDCNWVCPNGSREAGFATGPGHMTTGRLGWQQDLAT